MRPDAWPAWRETLLAAREQRPQPARDDKVVTAWNGLAIGALAEAGVVLAEPAFVAAAGPPPGSWCPPTWSARVAVGSGARRAGAWSAPRPPWPRTTATSPRACSCCTRRPTSRCGPTSAEYLLDLALQHFLDTDGGFHDTADDAEALIARPKDTGDNATPCGTSALAGPC